MIAIGGHECRTNRDGMCGDRGVEIFDPRTSPFEASFDLAKGLADGIRPLGSWEF